MRRDAPPPLPVEGEEDPASFPLQLNAIEAGRIARMLLREARVLRRAAARNDFTPAPGRHDRNLRSAALFEGVAEQLTAQLRPERAAWVRREGDE